MAEENSSNRNCGLCCVCARFCRCSDSPPLCEQASSEMKPDLDDSHPAVFSKSAALYSRFQPCG